MSVRYRLALLTGTVKVVLNNSLFIAKSERLPEFGRIIPISLENFEYRLHISRDTKIPIINNLQASVK